VKPAATADVFVGIPQSGTVKKEEPKKAGKGGLVAAVLGLAIVGGGAGAYFAGLFGGSAVEESQTEETKAPDTTQTAGTGSTLGAGTGTAATTDAAPAGTETTATDSTVAATTETADAETTPQGQTETATDTATDTATTDAAATETPPLDARGKQLAWLRAYDGGPCVYLEAGPDTGDKVAIEGFAASVGPLTKILSEFTAAQGTEPDLNTRVVTNPQCPVLDFVKRLQSDTAIPVYLVLDNATGVVRSGEPVTGRIEGLAGRAVTLFSVNTEGATTNLKNFVQPAADGTVTFNFKLKLTDETEPVPQLLMALVTDLPVKRLDSLPAGVTARTLMPFIAAEAEKARQVPIASLKQLILQK
jgi:serine/threonine-protein kinase